MIRDITLGQYYQADSVIHKLDPMVKLIATFVYIISLFVVDNLIGYAICFTFLAVAIGLSKVPVKFMVRGMKAIFMLLLITVLFNLFLTKQGEVLFHGRQVPEQIARHHKEHYPHEGSDHVEAEKALVIHFGYTCHEGCKGAHDGHKTRVDDGKPAILGIELLRLVDVRAAHEPVVAQVDAGPDLAPHIVVEGVAHDGGRDEQHDQQRQVKAGGRYSRQRAQRKKQRVSGQERGNNQPCLTENDQEQNKINPLLILLHQLDQMLVDVQNEIN